MFRAWLFASTLLMLIGGWQAKMSLWRVGELIWFGKIPETIPDAKRGQPNPPRNPGFANIQYQPGKSFRAVDVASNIATPPIIFLTGAALMAVITQRSKINQR